jgi:hypothetical protein
VALALESSFNLYPQFHHSKEGFFETIIQNFIPNEAINMFNGFEEWSNLYKTIFEENSKSFLDNKFNQVWT